MRAIATVLIGFGMFLIGIGVGGRASRTQDAVVEQYQSWERQDQRDFVIAAVAHDPMLHRAIAVDWCATNKNTQLICWNARNMK